MRNNFTCLLSVQPLLCVQPASQVAQWLRKQKKKLLLQYRRCSFSPCVGKIPWRRKWQPTPAVLPGEFYGHWSLVGCSPWGRGRVGQDSD